MSLLDCSFWSQLWVKQILVALFYSYSHTQTLNNMLWADLAKCCKSVKLHAKLSQSPTVQCFHVASTSIHFLYPLEPIPADANRCRLKIKTAVLCTTCARFFITCAKNDMTVIVGSNFNIWFHYDFNGTAINLSFIMKSVQNNNQPRQERYMLRVAVRRVLGHPAASNLLCGRSWSM